MKKFIALLLALSFVGQVHAADLKISQLSTLSSPSNGDELPINAGGNTKKVTLSTLDTFYGITTHKNTATIHRSINDSGTGVTDLFSADKILTLLAAKAGTSHNHAATDINSGTLGIARGGTGLSTIANGKMLYASALDTLAALTLGSSLNITGATINTVDNTSTQKVAVDKNGTGVGTRKELNLIEGSGVTLTVTDNSGSDRVDVTIASSSSGFPTLYHGSAAPVYSSTSQFTIARIAERSIDDDTNIAKTTSTTVDIATTGLNGVAQSSNLTGTIAVTSGTNTVTGSSTSFNTDYIVGDVICDNDTAECRRITIIGGATSITVESNWGASDASSAYKRGGEAPNTHYYLYAMTNGTTHGAILSTRNVSNSETLVDLPSGYNDSRQMAFSVRNNSSSNIVKFSVSYGWPSRPLILYNVAHTTGSGPTLGTNNALNAGTAASYTNVALTSFIPKTSREAFLQATISTTNGSFTIGPSGESATRWVINQSASWYAMYFPCQTDSSQQVEYQRTHGTSSLYLDVAGYTVTEVP